MFYNETTLTFLLSQGKLATALVIPLALLSASALFGQPKAVNIPQPPYPYDTLEITYENKADGVTLAGALTQPKGPGPFPALLFVNGGYGPTTAIAPTKWASNASG